MDKIILYTYIISIYIFIFHIYTVLNENYNVDFVIKLNFLSGFAILY